ncbi:MAG: DUF4168 domain-containing protein [Myxococcota bacterium]
MKRTNRRWTIVPVMAGVLGLVALSACDKSGEGSAPPPAEPSPHGEPAAGGLEEEGATEPGAAEPGTEPAPQEPAPGAGGDPAGEPMPPAEGQGDPMGPQGNAAPGAPSGEGVDVSEAEIRTFAEIQLELMKVQQELHQRAQAGEDPNALQQELDTEVREILSESSLSEERFETIALQARTDGELRKRIEQSMRQQADG